MLNYLLRRFVLIIAMAFIISFASFTLLYSAPGGPLEQLASLQSTTRRPDPDEIERIMKRYDLDLDIGIRFLRWLIGHPRGAITINGQDIAPTFQIGCLKPGKAQLVYPDGRIEEINCAKPVYLRDLNGRPVSNGVVALDFGRSQQLAREQPVSNLINTRLGHTLLLMGVSTFLAIAIAIPIGVYSAVKQYSRFDYFFTTIAFFGSGMPTLFTGVMGILLFALIFKGLGLPYLPAGLAESNRDVTIPIFGLIRAGSVADRIWHLILPVSVLTFFSLAGWTRFIRSSMLEVLRQDYVRTARAKGLIERVVIMKHALRNALIPFVTLLAGVLPTLFGGAIITESVFSWPGIGKLFINSLTASDYPVAIAYLLISTFLTLVGFLLSDVLYTIVDPRIRMT
ncbi:MAG: ABC transporter permease [Anaerolineae bacterium]|nr:ABC transporter permease [Thermoflexales bacterium]MDW8407871.1 ABC transporter permease [Anaerolineae bacterium]